MKTYAHARAHTTSSDYKLMATRVSQHNGNSYSGVVNIRCRREICGFKSYVAYRFRVQSQR